MEQNHMLLPPPDERALPRTTADSPPHGPDQGIQASVHHKQQQPSPPQVPSCPPPAYSYPPSHHVPSLSFPDVPTTELAPIQPLSSYPDNAAHHHTLPSLSTITGSPSPPFASPPHQQHLHPREPSFSPPAPAIPPSHWPSSNPLTAYYTPSHVRDSQSPARMEIDAAGSGAPGRFQEARAASLSLDDPDVRMAAEALGDLKADFISSPPKMGTPMATSPPSTSVALQKSTSQDPEPLLSLLTTSHPLLATTIGGAQSAYIGTKNYSPRFKSGAEYVEGYITPIANTVGTVGRVTGVEGGVRWFLGGNRKARHQKPLSDLESGDGSGSNKRRKVDVRAGATPLVEPRGDLVPAFGQPPGLTTPTMGTDPSDPYGFTRKDRRLSMSTVDTLPAYDDYRSPAYTESADPELGPTGTGSSSSSSSPNPAWQSRLIMSTSGLSIAMSEESLRSLKYCLSWLRWANDHIGQVIVSIKSTLDQFDRREAATEAPAAQAGLPSGPARTLSDREREALNLLLDVRMTDASDADPHPRDHSEVAARIAALRSDVLKTLKDVIDTVSKYAGGALPDNARALVRKHLTSLPQRFRLATQLEASVQQQQQQEAAEIGGSSSQVEEQRNKEMRAGAERVLVLAKEGLDMMAQVSGVLDGTIVSAEEWCEKLGRRKREEREALLQEPATEPLTSVGIDGPDDGDVKMAG